MDNDETHLNICIDTERKQEAKKWREKLYEGDRAVEKRMRDKRKNGENVRWTSNTDTFTHSRF